MSILVISFIKNPKEHNFMISGILATATKKSKQKRTEEENPSECIDMLCSFLKCIVSDFSGGMKY